MEFPLVWLVVALLGVLMFYWVLRLAIGHGINDALQRAERRQEEREADEP